MMDTAGKNKGAARLLWYGLAALLLAAYLFILYGGLHPGDRMRPVYRALYVDHTFTNTDLAYYAVTQGTALAFTPDSGAGRLLGAGQWQAGPAGSCLTGSEGLLWVQCPAGAAEAAFTLYAGGETPVMLTLNGEPAAALTAVPTPQTVTVRLPQGAEGELLQFAFGVPAGTAGTLTLTEMSLC